MCCHPFVTLHHTPCCYCKGNLCRFHLNNLRYNTYMIYTFDGHIFFPALVIAIHSDKKRPSFPINSLRHWQLWCYIDCTCVYVLLRLTKFDNIRCKRSDSFTFDVIKFGLKLHFWDNHLPSLRPNPIQNPTGCMHIPCRYHLHLLLSLTNWIFQDCV